MPTKAPNALLFTLLIVALILSFFALDIKKWWNANASRGNSSHIALKPETAASAPADTDLPLDSKAAALACGKVMPLNKEAFAKLNLVPRFSQLASESGFTEAEAKALAPDMPLDEQEFEAYSFGYLTWDKSSTVSRADFDKLIMKSAGSLDVKNVSASDRAQLDALLVKFKRMMVKAFDLGRRDAKISPCQF